MSYDYTLFRAPRTIASSLLRVFGGKLGKAMVMAQALEGPPIGPLEEVKRKLSELFPEMTWQKTTHTGGFVMPKSEITDWSWRTTGGTPEVSLGSTEAGQVKLIKISRAEQGEIVKVSRAMHLTALDEQAFG